MHMLRARLTYIRGPHTNVRRGPFSHTRSQDFLWWCTFPLTTFLVVVVTFKHTLNVQTSKQRGNNFAVDRGPLAAGAPPMVQPAQWLIRPCTCHLGLEATYDDHLWKVRSGLPISVNWFFSPSVAVEALRARLKNRRFRSNRIYFPKKSGRRGRLPPIIILVRNLVWMICLRKQWGACVNKLRNSACWKCGVLTLLAHKFQLQEELLLTKRW